MGNSYNHIRYPIIKTRIWIGYLIVSCFFHACVVLFVRC